MGDLIITMGYLLVHFAMCLVLARSFTVLRTERGIFLFHAVSFVLTTLGATCAIWIFAVFPWSFLALVIGLHGIYSLSFLELWSLTQGSYSLSLVARVGAEEDGATLPQLLVLSSLGETKQATRESHLVKLGLLVPVAPGEAPQLTFFGAICARTFRAVLLLSNGRMLNP